MNLNWELEDHYQMDRNGSFEKLSEFERAVENGDLTETSDGLFVEESSGRVFDSRGDAVD